jgi:hypothetical protein
MKTAADTQEPNIQIGIGIIAPSNPNQTTQLGTDNRDPQLSHETVRSGPSHIFLHGDIDRLPHTGQAIMWVQTNVRVVTR